ncbi:retrovirus-related pol polyprotein from transposon TNT 1-94 [Tanacetum coccineum]
MINLLQFLGYGDQNQGNVTNNTGFITVKPQSQSFSSVGPKYRVDADVGGSVLGNLLAYGERSSWKRLLTASPTQSMVMASKTFSHLNFDYITLLSKKYIMTCLPKLKYVKDQLCSSCEMSKAKRSSFKSKIVPSSKGRLNLLHMDLCGPMRVASINGKKYILLVIVDDYSRYTWKHFY